MRFLARALDVLASLKLSCALFALLALLTWLGTLEQTRSGLYEVQRRYFESYVLLHDAGGVPVPLPGANLVLSLLFANLVAGGLVRLRKDRANAGILVAHSGIALLLVAAFVTHSFGTEGQVTLREGERASTFENPMRAELAVLERTAEGELREHLVRHEDLELARDGLSVRIATRDLPFWLEIERFLANARPRTANPHSSPHAGVDANALDGVVLVEEPRAPEAERNLPGARFAVVDARHGVRQEALTWIAEERPFAFVCDGRAFTIGLRRERHALPFEIALRRFTKEEHPRTSMPSSFESDVTVVEDGVERGLSISMNEPLRAGGVVVYQASWGPQGAPSGTRLFSTLAVARDPADAWPIAALAITSLGLAWHFGRKLARARARVEAAA